MNSLPCPRNSKNIGKKQVCGKMTLEFIEYADMFNWSVDNMLQKEILYNAQYLLLPLSELLVNELIPVRIDDSQYYQQVTVRSGGAGIEKRINGYKKGRIIKTRRQKSLRSGQLVMSRIDAMNGAFAVVPEELEGSIVTHDFLTFQVNVELARPQYLQLLLSSDKFSQLLSHGSHGTTKRQRVELDFLLKQQVPVPSLEEQDRILEEYNKILAVSDNNTVQAEKLEQERDAYFNTTLGIQEPLDEPVGRQSTGLIFLNYDSLVSWNVETALRETSFESDKYPTKMLSELQESILLLKRGDSPHYVAQSSAMILNQKCVRWNYIDTAYTKSVDENWVNKINSDYLTQPGDILINSTGEGTLGRSAVVDDASSNMVHDSHVLLLRVNSEVLNPTYLSLVINSSYGQAQIERLKSAKTTKQTELGVANLMKLFFPMPPKNAQDNLSDKVIQLNRIISSLKDVDAIKEEARTYFNNKIFN